MDRKRIVVFVFIIIILSTVECAHYNTYILKKECVLNELEDINEAYITLNDGTEYYLTTVMVEGETLQGTTQYGIIIEIDIHDIKSLWTEKSHASGFITFIGYVVLGYFGLGYFGIIAVGSIFLE